MFSSGSPRDWAGVTVTGYVDHPSGTMAETPVGGGHFTEVVLRPTLQLADPEQAEAARAAAEAFQVNLTAAGYGRITTEIEPAGSFYLAEDYHQQYLVKNPNGYCPVHATGVTCNPS